MYGLLVLLAGIVWSGVPSAEVLPDPGLARSVVKVMAYAAKGRVAVGSGVVVGANRVATNCHVTRAAHAVAVFKGAVRYRALTQAAAPELDLCLLHTTGMQLPSVRLGDAAASKPGDSVFVYGYPNAVGLSVTRGVVIRLQPYRAGWIIETDAGFMHGTSGGGLFNARGELIGLTTFMRRQKPQGYYAIPASWLAGVRGRTPQAIAPLEGVPFWQSDPAFLDRGGK